jgi:Ca2+-binding RTX toxin-like protein
MTTFTLTAGNDTVSTDYNLFGTVNGGGGSLDLLNNIVNGEAGIDTFAYADSYPSGNFTLVLPASGGIELVATVSAASGGGSSTQKVTLKNFELLQFDNLTYSIAASAGADLLNGTAGNDVIRALAGADYLQGNAGNDTLDGGTGSDSMVGGAGNDTYVVDVLTDKVVDTSGTDTVRVAIATAGGSYTLGASVENGTLTNAVNYNLTGNALANTLKGNAFNNVLNGGAGSDQMAGLAGNDTYIVGVAGDVVTEGINAGIDTVKVGITTTGGSYTLGANIENGTLTNTVAFNITGNALANTLIGNAAANTLNGGGGNDTLDGRAGADRMNGGTGNDTYVVGTGDVVTEAAGAGTDLVKVAISTTGGSYTLGANVENGTLTNTVAFNLTGNTLANTLIGNGAANVLNGGDGADQLHGGAGADQLTGGNGSDRFYFDSLFATSNVDTVTDFTHGSDRLMLDDALFTALGVVGSTAGTALDANSFRLGSVAAEADDRILYDAATGKLYYDPTGSATAGDEVQFAVLGASVHPTLDASDFLVV